MGFVDRFCSLSSLYLLFFHLLEEFYTLIANNNR